MRPKLIFILLFFVIFSQCSSKRLASTNAVLTLQFGTYYNWTYYELRQINFRVSDEELLIDTTYNLKLEDFKIHFTEKAKDYPEITQFLTKSSLELKDLSKELSVINQVDCGRINEFWIQIEEEKKINLIKLEWAEKCNSKNIGRINSVLEEMLILKDKYK